MIKAAGNYLKLPAEKTLYIILQTDMSFYGKKMPNRHVPNGKK